MGFGLTYIPTILKKCIWCITFYLPTEGPFSILIFLDTWVRNPKAHGVTEAKVRGRPYFILHTNAAFPSSDSFPLHPLKAGILYRLTLGAYLPKLQPEHLCTWMSLTQSRVLCPERRP